MIRTHESSPSFRDRLESGSPVLLELEVVVVRSLLQMKRNGKDQDRQEKTRREKREQKKTKTYSSRSNFARNTVGLSRDDSNLDVSRRVGGRDLDETSNEELISWSQDERGRERMGRERLTSVDFSSW